MQRGEYFHCSIISRRIIIGITVEQTWTFDVTVLGKG
jgi:hypothetical protein